MLSALANIFAAFGRFGSWDFDRRGFNARPLEQLLREPRRIEILDQTNIAHFQSDVVYYRRLQLRCFLPSGLAPKSKAVPMTIEDLELDIHSLVGCSVYSIQTA